MAGFPKVVLFDLDGTLLDSAPDMLATINVMKAARNAAPMALVDLRPLRFTAGAGSVPAFAASPNSSAMV